jgi:hypothetical protein
MNTSINYVIACWSGDRRGKTPNFEKDNLYYIRNHIDSLKELKHNLTQITVVIPFNPYQSVEYSRYIDNLPKKIQHADVVVIYKENYGQSYGSYSRTYEKYRKQFDYYIFIEDDYVFVQNNFDQILVSLHGEKSKCGYLCSLVLNTHGRHAALSNGIASSDTLEIIFDKYGKLPHSHLGGKEEGYDTGPQLDFSFSFFAVNTQIYDTTHVYRAPYNHMGKLFIHAEQNKQDLIVPIQFRERLASLLPDIPDIPKKSADLYIDESKILILLLYYNRPNMVKTALKSIKDLNYTSWELAFIDDGSEKVGKPIVEEVLKDSLDKVKFYRSDDKTQDKLDRGGSLVGEYMNLAIEKSDANICIMLCDDDALEKDYFTNLNKWFKDHPNKMYCYSHVILFDPFSENPDTIDPISKIHVPSLAKWGKPAESDRFKNFWNKTKEINCANQVDAAQVAWRKNCQAGFPSPRTKNLDAIFYSQLYNQHGKAPFSGFFGQYKGIYSDALDTRSKVYQPKDVE